MSSPDKNLSNYLLLIDDDDDMIAIGEQVFAKAGYKFISAASGKTGLGAMLEHKPDIVIVDYLLPDMKGEDVIKKVAGEDKYRELRATPFVILTAWEESLHDIDRLYSLGLKAYLTKPFGHRELRCVVDNIVRLNRIERRLMLSDSEVQAILDDEGIDLVQSLVGLSRQLLDATQGELDERQSLDLNAIYNCSIKLMRKIAPASEKGTPQDVKTRTVKYDSRGHS